eukprot:2513422-Rhodomonas_salina.5
MSREYKGQPTLRFASRTAMNSPTIRFLASFLLFFSSSEIRNLRDRAGSTRRTAVLVIFVSMPPFPPQLPPDQHHALSSLSFYTHVHCARITDSNPHCISSSVTWPELGSVVRNLIRPESGCNRRLRIYNKFSISEF